MTYYYTLVASWQIVTPFCNHESSCKEHPNSMRTK